MYGIYAIEVAADIADIPYSQVPKRPHGGKFFTRLENDIDIGSRATEMCPNIKAIDIWLPDPEFFLPNAAAIF